MFFRNLRTLRLDEGWNITAQQLNDLLAAHEFKPCGATDHQSFGWVPPSGEPGKFVVTVGDNLLIALGAEQKLITGAVVRQYANERAKEIEEQQGFKPGRGQMREIREQVMAELLLRAFVKRRVTYVWIDTAGRWMGIDAASGAKADEVVEQLKIALDALPLLPLRTALTPSTVMTAWLAQGEAPAGFSIDRDCELRSVTEEKAAVRYSHHSLDAEDIKPHLAAGKKATRLALTWDDRISFVLNEDGSIKRLAFLDILMEESVQRAGYGDDLAVFDADFAIMSGELSRLLASLVDALGGEAQQ